MSFRSKRNISKIIDCHAKIRLHSFFTRIFAHNDEKSTMTEEKSKNTHPLAPSATF
ncbi:hypothetical protein [Helicobacter sp. T3_23-1059]